MKLSESIQEKLLLGLPAAILGGLGVVCTSIWKETSKPFADYVLSKVSSTNLLWLCLLLFLLASSLASWVLVLILGDRTARIRKNYEHLPRRGFGVHKKTGQRVCGNCLIKGIESPLHYTDKRAGYDIFGWVCGQKDCEKEYDYEKDDLPSDKKT